MHISPPKGGEEEPEDTGLGKQWGEKRLSNFPASPLLIVSSGRFITHIFAVSMC